MSVKNLTNNPRLPIINSVLDYANLVTLIGLVLSVTGIYFAITKYLHAAGALLGLALLADMFDGWVARKTPNRMEVLSKIGTQLDSLSDVVHGAILSGIILSSLANYSEFAIFIAVLLSATSVIRLAYFTVFGPNEDGSYTGLPVIFNSFSASLAPILIIGEPQWILCFSVFLLLLSALNVSSFRVPKLKGKSLIIFNFITLLGVIFNLYLEWFKKI